MNPDNYFGQLLIDLSDFIAAQVPEIKWIDQDLGQLDIFEYRPDVAFPAILIDFDTTNYEGLGELAQLGMPRVTLKLVTCPFSGSYQSAPIGVRQKAVNYYALEQKIFNVLQGWYTDYTTPFTRVAADTNQKTIPGLRIRDMAFTTSYQDFSAMPMTSKQHSSLQIDTNLL
jgi:hypothetical protein